MAGILVVGAGRPGAGLLVITVAGVTSMLLHVGLGIAVDPGVARVGSLSLPAMLWAFLPGVAIAWMDTRWPLRRPHLGDQRRPCLASSSSPSAGWARSCRRSGSRSRTSRSRPGPRCSCSRSHRPAARASRAVVVTEGPPRSRAGHRRTRVVRSVRVLSVLLVARPDPGRGRGGRRHRMDRVRRRAHGGGGYRVRLVEARRSACHARGEPLVGT